MCAERTAAHTLHRQLEPTSSHDLDGWEKAEREIEIDEQKAYRAVTRVATLVSCATSVISVDLRRAEQAS